MRHGSPSRTGGGFRSATALALCMALAGACDDSGPGIAGDWDAGGFGGGGTTGTVGDGRELLGQRCDGIGQCPGALICVAGVPVGGQCGSHCRDTAGCTRFFENTGIETICVGATRPQYCVRACRTSADCKSGTACDTTAGWCRVVTR